jgi:chromosome partitioning protein
MAHTFVLTNAKGGCGKTTVALNLAICFARAGYLSLAIDLDQQGNLSAGLGVDLNKLSLTAHGLIINETPDIRRYLVEIRPQLHLLPNTIDIEADDLLEAKKVNRELLLRRQIKPIQSNFDVILIDTPPAMHAATVNALVVADTVIIPIFRIQPDYGIGHPSLCRSRRSHCYEEGDCGELDDERRDVRLHETFQ